MRQPAALTNKGMVLRDIGRYEEALDLFSKALKQDNNYAKAWMEKGSTLHRLGKYDVALQSLDMALDINPLYAAAWESKGNILSDWQVRKSPLLL
jgi:tetratricopeptide (TPR) repeat protein